MADASAIIRRSEAFGNDKREHRSNRRSGGDANGGDPAPSLQPRAWDHPNRLPPPFRLKQIVGTVYSDTCFGVSEYTVPTISSRRPTPSTLSATPETPAMHLDLPDSNAPTCA